MVYLKLFSVLLAMMLSMPLASRAATHTSRLADYLDRLPEGPGVEVTVILEAPRMDAAMRALIRGQGGALRFSSGRRHELRIPAGRLWALLGLLPADVFLRFPYPHAPAAVTGEGVALTGAADVQALGTDGSGIKVGIIDLGFGSLSAAQASGDLPADLVITDYTGNGTGGTTHGTQVAEIVHEMAPGARLYLARVATSLQLEQAVNDMIVAGVRVINHSVAWFAAAYYDGTGPLCSITATADANGVQWVNAAGNSRNQHYMATFSDSDGDLRHEFASGQNYNTISLTAGKSVTLILNWDAYPVTREDYNLFLYDGDPDAGAALVASSTTTQNGTSSSVPYEVITYTPAATQTFYIVVAKANAGDADLPFTLFSNGANLDIRVHATSLVQPADCDTVLSVAATNLTDGPEGFSSEGPTTDGRAKPDIAGPDRVQTSLSTSFAGTSAASPHVAGAAALVLAQSPALTPAQLRAALIATVKDVSTAGYDYRTGYGRLSLDADGDGFNHDEDNCPLVYNPDQLDTDGDLAGDACDLDDDNDGLADALEAAIGTDPLAADTDGDGLGDYFEVAFDGDAAAYTPGQDLNPLAVDTDGDGLSDAAELTWDGNGSSYVAGADLNPLSSDTDGDGLPDGTDPIPLDFNYADGDVGPAGAPDGMVDVADYLAFQQMVLGALPVGTLELSHGDLYPPGAPDGVIDLSDLVLMRGLLAQ